MTSLLFYPLFNIMVPDQQHDRAYVMACGLPTARRRRSCNSLTAVSGRTQAQRALLKCQTATLQGILDDALYLMGACDEGIYLRQLVLGQGAPAHSGRCARIESMQERFDLRNGEARRLRDTDDRVTGNRAGAR